MSVVKIAVCALPPTMSTCISPCSQAEENATREPATTGACVQEAKTLLLPTLNCIVPTLTFQTSCRKHRRAHARKQRFVELRHLRPVPYVKNWLVHVYLASRQSESYFGSKWSLSDVTLDARRGKTPERSLLSLRRLTGRGKTTAAVNRGPFSHKGVSMF